MMNFPTPSYVGQQYSNGFTTYQWDGTGWNIVPQMGPVYIGDNPPANPAIGQQWLRTSNGQLYVWFDDGTSKQWIQVGGSTTTVKTARTRNRINNPTAMVSQENGTTAVTTSVSYPADQWALTFVGIVSQAQRVSMATPSPDGTITAVAITATTAKASLAAGDYLTMILPIEGYDVIDLGWGTAKAEQAVLRFCAVADTAGTYAFSIINGSANNRSFVGTFTIAQAGVPQVFSFAIPGDTTGTWPKDNSGGLWICFTHCCGSTNTGVAGWNAGLKLSAPGCINAAATANSKLYVTDVGLYADPDNTGLAPPFVAPSYEDDLARCQRYWEPASASVVGYAQNNGGAVGCTIAFKATKRNVPTVSSSGGTSINVGSEFIDTADLFGLRYGLNAAAQGQPEMRGRVLKVNARLI